MPYLAKTSLNDRYTASFTCEPKAPKVLYTRPAGSLFDLADLPVRARQNTRHKFVPDFRQTGDIWFVSERFRDLVEELEPGLHGFHPLPHVRKDGTPVEGRYFIFDDREPVDAIVEEASPGVNWEPLMVHEGVFLSMTNPGQITFRRSLVGHRHVWRGRTYLKSLYFFSDPLAEQVERLGLKKLYLTKTLDSL